MEIIKLSGGQGSTKPSFGHLRADYLWSLPCSCLLSAPIDPIERLEAGVEDDGWTTPTRMKALHNRPSLFPEPHRYEDCLATWIFWNVSVPAFPFLYQRNACQVDIRTDEDTSGNMPFIAFS